MTVPVSDFLAFGAGPGNNAQSQAGWAALIGGLVSQGFVDGTAITALFNKAFRQPSQMTAALAQVLLGELNQNISDTDPVNPATLPLQVRQGLIKEIWVTSYYGALDPQGQTSSNTAFANALNALGGEPGCVRYGLGTYAINQDLSTFTNTFLRGPTPGFGNPTTTNALVPWDPTQPVVTLGGSGGGGSGNGLLDSVVFAGGPFGNGNYGVKINDGAWGNLVRSCCIKGFLKGGLLGAAHGGIGYASGGGIVNNVFEKVSVLAAPSAQDGAVAMGELAGAQFQWNTFRDLYVFGSTGTYAVQLAFTRPDAATFSGVFNVVNGCGVYLNNAGTLLLGGDNGLFITSANSTDIQVQCGFTYSGSPAPNYASNFMNGKISMNGQIAYYGGGSENPLLEFGITNWTDFQPAGSQLNNPVLFGPVYMKSIYTDDTTLQFQRLNVNSTVSAAMLTGQWNRPLMLYGAGASTAVYLWAYNSHLYGKIGPPTSDTDGTVLL